MKDEFEFDRDKATKNETYKGRTFDKGGEYEVRVRKGSGEVYDYSGHAVGLFVAKSRADEVRKLVVSALNHPTELKARVDEAGSAARDNWESRTLAEATKDRGIKALIREALEDRVDYKVQDGNALLVQYDKGGWNGASWYMVERVGDVWFLQDPYGYDNFAAVLHGLKREHTGPIASISRDGTFKIIRKGNKVDREFTSVVRLYHGERRSRGYGMKQGPVVRVNEAGRLDSKHYRTPGGDYVPLEFTTMEEADAWIAAREAENGYAVFVTSWVQKPVKKEKVA